MKFIKLFALTLLLSGCFEKEPNLTIKTIDGDVNYNLEVAIKPEEQSRGLMERTSLAENGGMLFPIAPVQPVTMWMMNTKISLDIIFVGADNRIVRIIENAEPMSTKHLVSGYPVKAVIEVNAGDTAKHGFKVGQYVKSSALDKFEADYKAQKSQEEKNKIVEEKQEEQTEPTETSTQETVETKEASEPQESTETETAEPTAPQTEATEKSQTEPEAVSSQENTEEVTK